MNCYLGANFVRAFVTIHDHINNQLIVSAADKRVDLEVARVSSVEALEVSAIGLEDVSEWQRSSVESSAKRTKHSTARRGRDITSMWRMRAP